MDPASVVLPLIAMAIGAATMALWFRKNTPQQNLDYMRSVGDDVVAEVTRTPGITAARLQERLGRNSAAIRKAVNQEIARGRIESRGRGGRGKALYPKDHP